MSLAVKTTTGEELKPGTVILRCKPYAFALNKDSLPNSCDHCLKSTRDDSGLELSRCSGCHLVRYCDRECQKKGWSDGHKWECKGFKDFGKVAPTYARLLLRIICRLKSESDHYDVVPPKTHRRFKDLVSHFSDVRKDSERIEQVETFRKVVESVLSHHPKIVIPNESEFVALCGRVFVNTFCIMNQEFREMGSALYVGASIFDHSCEPMAVATFTGTTIEVRNIVPLASNFPIDRVKICYQDALRSSIVRRTDLKKSYYFECQCERCSVQMFDADMLAVYCQDPVKDQVRYDCEVNPKHHDRCPKCGFEISPEYAGQIAEAEGMIMQKIHEMVNVTYLDVCETCISVMNTLNFSDTHWMKTHMAYVAFEACVERESWGKAFQYGQLALKGQRKYLLGYSANLGISLLKLAKLAWFMEKDSLAQSYLEDALKIVLVTHGHQSELVQKHIRPLFTEINAARNMRALSI